MKIFISHATVDRWVARKIAEDFDRRGIITFLDEKNIETGESIDESVRRHLTESDEVLLLLSPSSLKSHWVFIEVGGAAALGKRIATILLHVGSNEIPQPLSRYLARDINDVERYYEEIEKRKHGAVVAPKEKPRPSRKRRKNAPLAVGMRVKIIDGSLLSKEQKEQPPKWLEHMDFYSGKVATVKEIKPDGAVMLDNGWAWLPEWLEPVS